MTASVRWAGVCLVVAGLLTLPAVTHPNILDVGLAEAALTPLWTAVHASGLAVVALSLAAVAGLALIHGATWGRLGAVAVVLTLVGLVATAGLSALEAFAFPAVARNDPGLLDFDGPIAGTTAFWILAGLASLWLLGEALLGISIARAGVLSRAPAVALTVGALSFAAFEGPFVPVLGQVSVVLFALGQMWLGVELVRARQSVSGASPAPPGSRSNAEMR